MKMKSHLQIVTEGPMIFIRTNARAASISTLQLLEAGLSDKMLERCWLVCNYVDEDFTSGKYGELTTWADRILVGPAGAHHIVCLLDFLVPKGKRCVVLDDNIKRLQFYDQKEQKLVNLAARRQSGPRLARFLTPPDSLLQGAILWGASLAHEPKMLRSGTITSPLDNGLLKAFSRP